jgi:HEAT repeat protein
LKISLRKLGAFTFLAILSLLVIGIWDPSEPRYEGRRLSVWARDVASPQVKGEEFLSIEKASIERQRKHDEAVAAIRHIGARALPAALKLCQARDYQFQKKLETWADKGNLDIHLTSAGEKQIEGEAIIEVLGPTAKPIIPDLIKLFQDEYPMVADEASFALRGIGPEAIPPLIYAFTNSDDPRVQHYAAYSLGLFRSKAREAVPLLVSSLQNKSSDMRDTAAWALGRIGEDAPVVVPALAQCLQVEADHDFYQAIERFGTNAQSAVPTLVRIIDSRRHDYLSALSALHKINPRLADNYFTQLGIGLTNQPTISP